MTANEEAPRVSLLPWLVGGIVIASLVVIALASNAGSRLRLAGASTETGDIEVVVGNHRLALPENAIRFADQRIAGPARRVDLYLAWPGLSGFSEAERARFETTDASGLIFLTLSQDEATQTKTAEVRDIPVEGKTIIGGLQRITRSDGTISADELGFVSVGGDQLRYRVTCLADQAMAADCIRIHPRRDKLAVSYRFSQTMLADWQRIDAAVGAWIDTRERRPAG